MKPKVSVCIPVYYSGPDIPRVVDELLQSIAAQDYPKHLIKKCVSLQSCEVEQFEQIIKPLVKHGCVVIFPKDDVNCPALNTNSAIGIADSDYIKIMNQDDFLDSPTAISEMVELLESTDAKWLINSCVHTDGVGQVRERLHIPQWPGEKGMVEGVNRFGCPSVAMFHSSITPECDPKLELCLDCDLWIQLYRKAGMPVLRNVPDVVIRMWDAQLSQRLDYARALETDKAYMRRKYGYT